MASRRPVSSRYLSTAGTTGASRLTAKSVGNGGYTRRRAALGDRTNTTAASTAGSRAGKASKATARVPRSRAGTASRLTTRSTAATTRSVTSARATTAEATATLTSTEPAVEPPIVPAGTPAVAHLRHEDIDIDDREDPQQCAEYVEEIMSHLRAKEVEYLAPPDYMEAQADINPKMRAILVDWIVEVHLKFKLLQETLYLCINVIDRFLAKRQVARNKLQLVGISSLLIASKYEEIYAPEVRDFVYICDQAYTKDEILKMERAILATLNFALVAPSPLHFLRRFSKAAHSDLETHTLCKYLIELTLVDYECVQYLPSTVAASALCLALKITGRGTWDSTLEYYSQYDEETLLPCMNHVTRLQARADRSKYQAVQKKYSTQRFLEVATLPIAEY